MTKNDDQKDDKISDEEIKNQGKKLLAEYEADLKKGFDALAKEINKDSAE